MKIKIKKSAYLGIFLMFLMVGSTVAYAVLQAFNQPQQTAEEPKLPKENIIDYELDRSQELYAIRYGKTILKYEYATACVECANEKALLESLARQFSDQLILEELSGADEASKLTITSYYGRRLLRNITEDTLVDTLCDLMSNPPVFCATKNI